MAQTSKSRRIIVTGKHSAWISNSLVTKACFTLLLEAPEYRIHIMGAVVGAFFSKFKSQWGVGGGGGGGGYVKYFDIGGLYTIKVHIVYSEF